MGGRSCLGGVMVSMLAIRPKVQTWPRWIFKGDKSLQHAFLWRGSILCNAKFIIPFACYSCLLPDDSADRNAKELWWMNQEFSSVDIIPAWFSMLIYHLGDEQ
jgi:hypothetical protein